MQIKALRWSGSVFKLGWCTICFNLSTAPFFKRQPWQHKRLRGPMRTQKAVMRWSIGSLLADEASSWWVSHMLESHKAPARGWVLSNWFYPIMNCEGPADVWDHQCQQLIKKLGSKKMIVPKKKKANEDQKERLVQLSECTLHLPFFAASWCNVSKNTGAHWLSNVTGRMCFSSRWVTGPCLLMRLMNQCFWSERMEQDRRKLWDTVWQKSFLLKPPS